MRFLLVLSKLVTPERRVSALCRQGRVATRQNDITTAVYPADVGKISTLLGQVLLQLGWVLFCVGFFWVFLTQQSSPSKGAEVSALMRG